MNQECVFKLLQVGSLAAIHLGKRGYKVDLYEYREGSGTIRKSSKERS